MAMACIFFAQDQKVVDIEKLYERKRIPSRRLKQATTPWLIECHVEYLRVATEVFDCWPQRIARVRL